MAQMKELIGKATDLARRHGKAKVKASMKVKVSCKGKDIKRGGK